MNMLSTMQIAGPPPRHEVRSAIHQSSSAAKSLLALPSVVAPGHREAMPAISRGLSVAIPPVMSENLRCTAKAVPDARRVGEGQTSRVSCAAGTAARCFPCRLAGGVVAALLNPRLMAGNPPGCGDRGSAGIEVIVPQQRTVYGIDHAEATMEKVTGCMAELLGEHREDK